MQKEELLEGIESENSSVHSVDDAGKKIVIQRVRCIRGKMIMRIAKEGGVGDHQSRKALFPE